MFLDEYEINRTALLAVAAVVIAALSVYVIFNVIYAQEGGDRATGAPARPLATQAFDAAACNGMLPAIAGNTSTKDYRAGYHIDGSSGDLVVWNASEQPPAVFALDTFPRVFFVSSNGEFEGCGYSATISNTEKLAALRSSFNYSVCGKSMMRIDKEIKDSYDKFTIYIIEPGNMAEYTITTAFVAPKYEHGNELLQKLGCSI